MGPQNGCDRLITSLKTGNRGGIGRRVQSHSKGLTDPLMDVLYYFGDLQYWKLPQIAADALEQGHDGDAAPSSINGLKRPEVSLETL
jgi:hypothetical protein